MNAQRISLSRIVALNWYGFRQIIDIAGNTLVAGAFGSGKSVLLDLMQYVLLGEHWRPNRAAAGNARGRSLVSYCLCDTNLLREGEPHYTRRNGVTIIALEFTWPAERGQEPRRETWGIRIQYDSATSDPKRTYFGIPDRLTWEMLAPGEQLRSDEDFRTFLRREYGNDTLLPTQGAYLAEMATPRHLWFDREQLNKTLWKSIAFEPEADVEKFIRDFILEESPVDVREVQRSVQAYRETQQTLALQEAEAVTLREVCRHDDELRAAQRKEKLCAHLGFELENARLEELVGTKKRELADLDVAHEKDNADFTAKSGTQERLKKELAEFRLDPGEEELRQKESEKREVHIEKKGLVEAQESVRKRLRTLAQRWGAWLRRGGELGVDGLPQLLAVEDALLGALSAPSEEAGLAALPALAERFSAIFRDCEKLLVPIDNAVGAAEKRLREIVEALEKLERKETPGTFPLLQAIKARSGEVAVEQLCRVVEVKPEADADGWRAAIEMLLGRQRFAVIVATGELFREGLAALKKIPPGARGPEETVVHPREAREMPCEVKRGSLAEKVEVRAPQALQEIAEKYVRHLLGQVIAVDSAEALDSCDRGITRESIYKQKPLRRKLRQLAGYEFTLGREGLRRLAAELTREQKERMTEREAISAQARSVREWLDSGVKSELGSQKLPDRSGELHRLPGLQTKLDLLTSQIEKLETPERSARLEQRAALERELATAIHELGVLTNSRQQYTLARQPLVDQLANAESELATAKNAAEASHGALPADVTGDEIASRTTAIRLAHKTWRDRSEAARTATSNAHDTANDAANARSIARLSLRNTTDEKGHPKFPHWRYEEQDEDDNARWRSRLTQLGTDIEKFRELAGARRQEWERRLKDQVLNRLKEHSDNAERTVRQLRTYLDQKVGQHRYRISQRRDPAFATLWSLLDSGFEPTDELLAVSRRVETQQVLDELMRAVELGDKAEERLRRLLDYRQFHRYDLEAVRAEHSTMADAPTISLGRSGRNLSGGENQAPFFISMLAAYRRVYDLGSGRSQHLGLVVMDEAFSKLSGDGVEDCLALAENFNLQLIMAFPIDRLGVMVRFAETTIVCRKEEQRDASGYVTNVDNLPILVTPEQVEEALG